MPELLDYEDHANFKQDDFIYSLCTDFLSAEDELNRIKKDFDECKHKIVRNNTTGVSSKLVNECLTLSNDFYRANADYKSKESALLFQLEQLGVKSLNIIFPNENKNLLLEILNDKDEANSQRLRLSIQS